MRQVFYQRRPQANNPWDNVLLRFKARVLMASVMLSHPTREEQCFTIAIHLI